MITRTLKDNSALCVLEIKHHPETKYRLSVMCHVSEIKHIYYIKREALSHMSEIKHHSDTKREDHFYVSEIKYHPDTRKRGLCCVSKKAESLGGVGGGGGGADKGKST